MGSEQDRKLVLLETLVNNQKHVIDLLSILNNNVEELILDIKDIKNNQKYESSSNINVSGSSCSNSEMNLATSNNLRNNEVISMSYEHQIHLKNTNNQIHHEIEPTAEHQNQHQSTKYENIEIDSANTLSVSRQHNFINSNNNRLENLSPNNDDYKSVKTGLREFSTFVSKMVRQEFGSNFLALTRINELDRYTMQKIRDEAISKYLPSGISPQFAWNHAMNSLRQLRHRQCKKARIITYNQKI